MIEPLAESGEMSDVVSDDAWSEIVMKGLFPPQA